MKNPPRQRGGGLKKTRSECSSDSLAVFYVEQVALNRHVSSRNYYNWDSLFVNGIFLAGCKTFPGTLFDSPIASIVLQTKQEFQSLVAPKSSLSIIQPLTHRRPACKSQFSQANMGGRPFQEFPGRQAARCPRPMVRTLLA